MRRLVEWMMIRSLRRHFRRLCWDGPLPAPRPGVPLILYANHHHFFDGYILWYLVRRVLGRPAVTWMAEWNRFPFFAAAGALPFPPDARTRASTIRRTAHRFRTDPDTVLIYFPEGVLHPPEDGVLPFDDRDVQRLGRLFPEANWWPVALNVSWWGEPLPTGMLAGGAMHAAPDGREGQRLGALLGRARAAAPHAGTMLFERPNALEERWDFSATSRFFNRYL